MRHFTTEQRHNLGLALGAIAEGPLYEALELEIIGGFSRAELEDLADRFPGLENVEGNDQRIVGGCLMTMGDHPISKPSLWSEWISVEREYFARLSDQWFALLPPLEYSRIEVEGPYISDGRIWRRIVYTVVNGGTGGAGEFWNGERWTSEFPEDLDGRMRRIATSAELTAANVDTQPLPPDYDPLAAR